MLPALPSLPVLGYSVPMIIIGAGMAGLLAAQILRRWSPIVWEAQPKLPDNHGALLRFRTDAVSRATGIPFKRVTVQKAVVWGDRIWDNLCPLPAQNSYSVKVTGKAEGRSIRDLSPGDRYIAPDDVLVQLGRGVESLYGKAVGPDSDIFAGTSVPVISTIPMPALMALAGWPERPEFSHRPIWSYSVLLPRWIDLYQTLYYPDPDLPYYRASITGRRLVIEYADVDCAMEGYDLNHDVKTVIAQFGLGAWDTGDDLGDARFSRQEYGKLLPTDDTARRHFIVQMSDRHNIYSVGRFATWRQILLDDVVNDCAVVNRFITERSAYGRRLATVRS